MNTFDWIEIRTGDAQKAAEFYESLFGWEVIRKKTAFADPDDNLIGLWQE